MRSGGIEIGETQTTKCTEVVITRMHADEEEKWGIRGGLVGGAAIEQVCGSV